MTARSHEIEPRESCGVWERIVRLIDVRIRGHVLKSLAIAIRGYRIFCTETGQLDTPYGTCECVYA